MIFFLTFSENGFAEGLSKVKIKFWGFLIKKIKSYQPTANISLFCLPLFYYFLKDFLNFLWFSLYHILI